MKLEKLKHTINRNEKSRMYAQKLTNTKKENN